jgi:uncharacterized protein (TIGR02266 family)
METAERRSAGEFDVDAELEQAEAELAHQEASLLAELKRSAAQAADLDRTLRSLRAQVAEAALAGVRDGALDARLKVAAVPATLDAGAAFQRSREARQAALEARREDAEAVTTQLAERSKRLAGLAQQLASDAKAAQRLATLARQKASAAAPVEVEPSAQDTLPPGVMATPVAVAPPPRPAARAPAPPVDAAKRAAKRVRMQATVDLSSDDNFFNGFSSNISDGGLFVATVNLVPIGTEVDLHFSLPSGEKVEARGVVRWVREVNDQVHDAFPGLGVQFTRLEGQAQQAVTRFVAAREPMFYAD